MSYKDYLQEQIQALTEDYTITVVDELDFNYNPSEKEILIVIKTLSGSVVQDVTFYPIQLNIFTSANEVNNTKKILKDFVDNYSNTYFNLELDYYKQDYATPVVMSNFIEIGETQRAELYVSGSLMMARNINDVSEVLINNRQVNYTNIVFSYTGNPNASKTTSENLQKTAISTAGLTITLIAYCQNDALKSLISLHKLGINSPNTKYTIKVRYTDNTEENYTCIFLNFTENYDITNPPTRNIVFALAKE